VSLLNDAAGDSTPADSPAAALDDRLLKEKAGRSTFTTHFMTVFQQNFLLTPCRAAVAFAL